METDEESAAATAVRSPRPSVVYSSKEESGSQLQKLQHQDHRVWEEPSKLFESMVVVGLPPNSDVQALQNLYFVRKFEGSGRFRNALGGQHQYRIEPNLEPQVLFVYPPEKQLPLKYKDLLSFCFPSGVEIGGRWEPTALFPATAGPHRSLEYPQRRCGLPRAGVPEFNSSTAARVHRVLGFTNPSKSRVQRSDFILCIFNVILR
ncbi:hypothetical protein C2S53_011457 [Perilla frutescens var. hirtella]|uniref:Uncharacterized protein n=1 Tax=Perilla frutescens var. hirtella TaxID=608512 RepID=A0AAD4P8C5_PERFH|nr:hypothetical protein C2S53_011457 [Perilla frutescens var. hirtella]